MSAFLGGTGTSLLFCFIISITFNQSSVSYIYGFLLLTVFIALVARLTIFKSKAVPQYKHVIVDRTVGEDKLRGEIIYETFFNYFVRFNTFSAGTWEEVVSKRSKEILKVW